MTSISTKNYENLKGPGVMTLLMMKTNKKKYKDHLQEYCDNIIYKQPFSPKVKVADLNVYAFSLLR